jgi:3'(2'), 5'-bisphosphate nucleotidase
MGHGRGRRRSARRGRHVVRFDDHAPFDYGKPGFANGFFIAHAPGVELKAP